MLAQLSTVIQQRGGLITECIFFCFQVDGPITGGAYKRWGEAHNRNFMSNRDKYGLDLDLNLELDRL